MIRRTSPATGKSFRRPPRPPPEGGPRMTTVGSIRAAAVTHPGRVREANEDCVQVGDWRSSAAADRIVVRNTPLGAGPFVCLVADGLGGHAAGEVASRRAVESIFEARAALAGPQEIATILHAVDADLRRHMRADPALAGMGTTIAGLVADANGARWFNVGDSRVYRVRDDGSLEQASVDDRFAPDLADALGVVANALTACLGGYPEPVDFRPHVGAVPPTKPSRWLLCSDGLTDEIDDDTIRACIEKDDEASVERLLDAALAAGGSDNVSIVLASFDQGTGAQP
jgi:serine/threonine protein phosphatase PrpC